MDETSIEALGSIFRADAGLEVKAVAALQRIVSVTRSLEERERDEQNGAVRGAVSLGTAILMAIDTKAAVDILKQAWVDRDDAHSVILNQMHFLGNTHRREFLEYIMERTNQHMEWFNFKAMVLKQDTDFNELLAQFSLFSNQEDLRWLIVGLLGFYEQDAAWKVIYDTLQSSNEKELIRIRAAESLSRWAFVLNDEKNLTLRRAKVDGSFQSALKILGNGSKVENLKLYGHVLIEAMRVRPSLELIRDAGSVLLEGDYLDSLRLAAMHLNFLR